MSWRGLGVSALLLVGCAGARGDVVLPTARYPVSLTAVVRGPKDEIVPLKELQEAVAKLSTSPSPSGVALKPPRLEIVGTFNASHTAWGMFYSLLPLSGSIDLSQEINQQVADAKGDAIVLLRADPRPCAFDWFIVFSILPFWPGCADVGVTGAIVKYVPGDVAAAPAPATSPQPALPSSPKPKRKKGRN